MNRRLAWLQWLIIGLTAALGALNGIVIVCTFGRLLR